MTMLKNVLIILLILVVFFFALAPNHSGPDSPSVITRIDTIIKHDTLRKYKKGDDIPFVVLDTIYQIDQVHDTAYIVNDYNKVKVYSDTLRINTDNCVYIQDTITQNRILGRSYIANLSEKTITITHDIYHKPKNELYLGLLGDLRRFDNKIGIGIGLNYKKQNESYIFNYTTNQISFGIYKKLF
jgi:hypothetical protein